MALKQHTSSTLDGLSEALARELRHPPGDDPMRPEQVIVGSPGIARWLRPRLAKLMGVCANVELPLPSVALGALVGALPGADDRWSPDALTWPILTLLDDLGDPVASYLADEADEAGAGAVVSRRRLAFAREVADILDRVNTWRPEWADGTTAWPAGAAWLEALHRGLVDDLGPPPLLDPAAALADAAALPSRCFVFGATSLPPTWQRAFDALAELRPGHLFTLEDHGPPTAAIQAHTCHGPSRQVEVLRDALLHLFANDHTLQPRHVLVLTPDLETYAPLVASVFSRRQPLPLPFHVVGRSLAHVNPVADAMLRVLDLSVGRATASEVLGLLSLWPAHQRAHIAPDELSAVRDLVAGAGIRWGIDGAHRRAAFGQPEDDGNTWEFGLRRLALGVAMADDPHVFGGTRPWDALEGQGASLAGRLIAFCRQTFRHATELRLAPHRTPQGWASALRAVLDDLTAAGARAQWLRRQVLDALDALDAATFEGEVDVRALRAWLAHRFDVPVKLSKEDPAAITVASFRPLRGVPFRVVCMLGMDEGAFPRRGLPTGFDPVLSDPRPGDPRPADQDRAAFHDAVRAAGDHLVLLWTGRDPHTNQRRAACVPVAELLDERRVEVVEHPLQPFDPRAFDPTHLPSFDPELHRVARAALTPPRERSVPPLFTGALPATEPPGPGQRSVVRLDDLISFYDNPAKHMLRRHLQVWLDEPDGEIADREPEGLGPLESWGIKDELLRWAAAERVDLDDRERVRALLRGGGMVPLAGAGDREADTIRVGLLETLAAWERAGGPDASTATVDLRLPDAILQGAVPGVVGDRLVAKEIRSFTPPGRKLGLWIQLLAAATEAPVRSARRFSPDRDGAPREDLLQMGPGQDPAALLADLVAIYLEAHQRRLPFFQHASCAFAGPPKRGSLYQVAGPEHFAGDGPPSLAPAVQKRYTARVKAAVDKWQPSDFSFYQDANCAYTVRLWGPACPFLLPTDGERYVSKDFARLALRIWAPFFQAQKGAK